MDNLSDLPNLGPVIEEQLAAVGVTTFDQLKAVGSKQAWLRILAIDASACYNRLCALEGALRGVKKICLDDAVKQDLKSFYNGVKHPKP